MTDRTI